MYEGECRGPKSSVLCPGFVTPNGGGYPPAVMQATGILDHLYARDMKTKPP
jgi:hypothetical protein